jgi:hypothetical protein
MPFFRLLPHDTINNDIITPLSRFLNAGGDLGEALRLCRDFLLYPVPTHYPKRIYTAELFTAFQKEWDKGVAQEKAYDTIAAQFRLDTTKGDSFIKSYRNWFASRHGRKIRRKGNEK